MQWIEQSNKSVNCVCMHIVHKKSTIYIISTSMHKYVSARTAFALFVTIFNAFGADFLKSHDQTAWKICHGAVKSACNVETRLCISAK